MSSTNVKKSTSCPGFESIVPEYGYCFCGQESMLWDGDAPIYCSSKCARGDAMAALIASERESSQEPMENENCVSTSEAKRKARILSKASQRLSAAYPDLDFTVLQGSSPRLSVRMSKQSVSHYRRMRALQPNRQVSTCLSCSQQKEHRDWRDQAQSSSFDSISEALNSPLSYDAQIESESKLRMGMTKREENLRDSYLSLAGSDMTFDLSYEDPVGWEGGGRVHSSNFMGLFDVCDQLKAIGTDLERSSSANEEGRLETPTSSLSEVSQREEGEPVIKNVQWGTLKDDSRQRDCIQYASSCADNLLAPAVTNTSPTLSLRRLMRSPSSKCANLLSRKTSKVDLSKGISYLDQPFRMSSESSDEREVQQLVSRFEGLIASKWNLFANKLKFNRPSLRKRAYSSHQASDVHPTLASASSGARHFVPK